MNKASRAKPIFEKEVFFAPPFTTSSIWQLVAKKELIMKKNIYGPVLYFLTY